VLTDEQRRYLEAGNAARARFYGAALQPADLTLALAWWQARADRDEARTSADAQPWLL